MENHLEAIVNLLKVLIYTNLGIGGMMIIQNLRGNK